MVVGSVEVPVVSNVVGSPVVARGTTRRRTLGLTGSATGTEPAVTSPSDSPASSIDCKMRWASAGVSGGKVSGHVSLVSVVW